LKRLQPVLAGLLLLSFAGCTVRNRLVVDGGGSLSAMPPGPVAVLNVTSRAAKAPKSEPFVYGLADTTRADAAFAELLAVAARDDAALEVIHPYDAEKQLRQREVTFSLQPDAELLKAEAEALGCAAYLTAELACWRHRFVFMASSAELRCRVTCRRAADDAVLWRADVDAEMRSMSDRELARVALKSMFEWLDQPHPPPAPNPPPLECE
jgi:hypothetical protein